VEGGDLSMSSIDERVVEMKINNSTFLHGVSETLKAMQSLDKGLNTKGPVKSLDQLAHGVETISSKLTAMGAIAATALVTITHQALVAGGQLTKSLTIGPIGQGFSDYNAKLTSVQTIMAATGASIGKVSGFFDQLDVYADKTIFNLRDMTSAFAKFTNAGVKMKDSVPAIKGIANMVALAGQGAGAAQIAFYNLSQSIAGGFLTTIDYKSLNLANVATKEWKDQMIAGAVAAGTLKKNAKGTYDIVADGSDKAFASSKLFTEGLSEGWATTDVLLKVLGDYGDATTAIGKKAQAAAQDVKSLPMMLDTLKAAVGTGWTETFELILGTLPEAKQLFTGLTTSIQGVLESMDNARNGILKDWKALGGRTVLIEALATVFHNLADILRPIKEAFRDIFPRMTGQRLFDLTLKLRDFADSLQISEETSKNLRRTFAGVFAIFSIIGQVIGEVVGLFWDLGGAIGEGSGGFLDFTGGVGDWLVKVDEALKKGEGLSNFFDTLGNILKFPIKMIQQFAGFMKDLFDNFDGSRADKMAGAFGKLADALTPGAALGERMSSIFGGLLDLIRGIGDAIAPVADKIQHAIEGIASALADSFSGENYDRILDTINTGLFAALILLFKRFTDKGLTGFIGGNGSGGIIGKIKSAFGNLTNVLQNMQANLKADTLFKIAAAVALLTVSVVALSLIDSDKLQKAMAGLAVGMGQLMAGLFILNTIGGFTGIVRIPALAAAMVLLAGAAVILAGAVSIFATMDWEEMGRGLTGMAAALVIVAGAMKLMPLSLPITGAGLVLVGIGLTAVSVAMKVFATMDWEEIGKGLTGVAGALVAIAAGMNLMPLSLPITAAGLVLVGTALGLISGAMKIFATMDWEEIGKGLAGVGGALVLIAGAMQLMPLSLPITAAGLILVGIALGEIAAVAKIFATMSWEEMGKAAAALAGALAIIAAGLYLMTGTLLGSAALLVAAAALTIITPILITLGNLSWDTINKGLLALGGAFAVLALGGALLTPVIVTLLGLGAAVLLLGAGMALAGAGVLAFASGIAILAAAGGAMAAVMTAILGAIIEAIPKMLKAFAVGLIEFAKVISQNGPQFVKVFVTVIGAMADAVAKSAPKIAHALMVLIETGLRVLRFAQPRLITAGFNLLMAILQGIEKNIGRIVHTVGNIIVNFLNALGKELPRITDAGVRLIIAFINGLTKAINAHAGEMRAAGGKLALALVDGMTFGLASKAGSVASKAWDIGKGAINAIKGAIDSSSPSKEAYKLGKYVTQGFALGLSGGRDDLTRSMETIRTLIKNQLDASRAEVEKQKAKLKKLRAADNPNYKAIRASEKALRSAELLYTRAANASTILEKKMQKQRTALGKLSIQYDKISEKLKAANEALDVAKQLRDDFAKSTTDKFNVLPEIDQDTTLLDYMDQIRKQTGDVELFKATLDKLRALGMDDVSYKKFLEEGIGSQPFLDQILASGPAAVTGINELNAKLATAAAALGTKAASDMYQAGVNAAQGLVDGLNKSMKTIEAQMTKIANAMVKAIKKALGIKSPAKALIPVGKFMNEGLAQGLEKYAHLAEESAGNVAKNALTAMQDTMAQIANVVASDIDINPTIAPVIDLTQFRKDAEEVNAALNASTMNATASLGQASHISAQNEAKTEANSQEEPERGATILDFTQNNYSPKALSPATIYRQTSNQLSVAKGALKP
jgi:hypothetical protein